MSRAVSARSLAITIALAGAILALGGAFALRPELVLEAVPELESVLVALDPAVVVLALAIPLVLLAPLLGILGRVRAPSPRPLCSDANPNASEGQFGDAGGPPSTGSIESTPTNASVTGPRKAVGESYERHLELATADDEYSRTQRDSAREQLVKSMRPIAATAVATRTGFDHEQAMVDVEAGTWTDDARAAAFLADDEGPSIPLSIWLLDLFRTSDPFVRRLEHTLEEIESLRDGSYRTASSIPQAESDRNRSDRTSSNRAGPDREVFS